MDTIEVDNFNLVMKKADYDVTVYQIWEKKCANAHAALDHARRDFRLAQRAWYADAAELFLHKYTKLLTWEEKAESIISQIVTFRRDNIMAPTGTAQDKIAMMCTVNWASLSIIPVPAQEKQAAVLTWSLYDNLQSLAVVIAPVWAYSKGKLHLQEEAMMKYLTHGCHNVDNHFSMLFKDQVDFRDKRPLMYPGRLVFPGAMADTSKSPWFNCDLRRLCRTGEIPQMSASAMKEVEDMSKDALPSSTDTQYVHGAPKFAQLGSAAWSSVFSGLFDRANLKEINGVLHIDLFANVGDTLRSFIAHRANYVSSLHLFWIGVCLTEKEAAYIASDIKEFMVDQMEAGSMPVPSGLGAPPQEAVPSENVPQPPKLNLLLINSDNKLQMPLAVVKEWQLHPRFGTQFTAWLDNFMKDYSVADGSENLAGSGDGGSGAGSGPSNAKRKSTGKASSASPNKTPKLEDLASFIVDAKDITDSLLAEAQMVGKVAPFYQIRTGHQLYVVSKSASDWQSPSLCMVAGYGKGSFKLIKPNDTETDVSEKIQFKMESQDDIVVFNGQLVTLGQVMNEQFAKKPDTEVCYHKLTCSENNPKEFTLEQTHNIMFSPVREEGDCKLGSVASREPVQSYKSAPCLRLLWTVRFTAKGLMPVKPGVYLTGSVLLPAGKALHCTKC